MFTPPENPAGGVEVYRTEPVAGAPFGITSVARTMPVLPGVQTAPDGLPQVPGVRRDHGRCVLAAALANCPGDEDDPMSGPAGDTQHPFYSFSWYVPVGCDRSAPNYSRLAQLAEQDLTAATGWQVSRQLWGGQANAGSGTESPSLVTAAVDLTDGEAAMNPRDAWSLLLDAYHDRSQAGGEAIMHVPYAVSGYCRDHQLMREAGAVMVGVAGERVSLGPGYPKDMGPVDSDPTADGETWLFVSGPVDLAVGQPLDPADPYGQGGWLQGVANPRRNEESVIRYRRAVLAFDVCAVFAARVVIPNDAVGGS